MCSILQAPLIVGTRFALETALASRVKDRLTPSRLAAFFHGLVATYYIFHGQWHESIHTTAQFFLLDLALHLIFQTKLSWEMLFHHVGGALLCIYAVSTKSYAAPHLAEHLTKALILMETTNPLLQILVTLRNEQLQNIVYSKCLFLIKFLFFFHFTFLRVIFLGRSLFYTYKHLERADSLDMLMFYLSLSMWCLQLFWLGKIVQNVRNI
jgi:hypothetical protein